MAPEPDSALLEEVPWPVEVPNPAPPPAEL